MLVCAFVCPFEEQSQTLLLVCFYAIPLVITSSSISSLIQCVSFKR